MTLEIALKGVYGMSGLCLHVAGKKSEKIEYKKRADYLLKNEGFREISGSASNKRYIHNNEDLKVDLGYGISLWHIATSIAIEGKSKYAKSNLPSDFSLDINLKLKNLVTELQDFYLHSQLKK